MGMFDFLADKGAPTWEDVQRRRAMVDALAQTGNPTTFGGGLGAVGGAIGAILGDRRTDKAEAERTGIADGVFEAALAGVPQDNAMLGQALGAAPGNGFTMSGDPLRDGIVETAAAIGADPVDLATAISYETAGTFDPTKAGPTTQWGQHRGLIQWGEPQARQYGVDWNDPIGSQLGADGAIASYFKDRGFKPGMSGLDLYSTINAGSPGRHSASDANNGGAPGTVADKWTQQMAPHREKAMALLGGSASPVQVPGVNIPSPPPVNVAMIRAINNPYLSPEQKQILAGVMAQQQAMQITPYQAAQLQMEQQRMAQAMMPEQPKPQGLLNAGDGNIYDPNTGEWITPPQAEQAGYRAATPDEAAQYGAPGGQFGPDGRFYPVTPPSGFAVETGPDGQVRVVQGAGASGAAGKPFTEGQSKDNVFATRAEGALSVLDPIAPALTSRTERIAEEIPLGMARGLQTDDFQVARNAGDEFLQAILRKDTGAAITEQEQALYGRTYLPYPGDSEAVLAQKGQARRRAVEAIKAGMSPAQIVAQERALQNSGSERLPPVDQPAPQRRRYNPATGEFE